MSTPIRFEAYQAKTILNKHKHTDHWFWTRYSAYPYVGCQHGCEFCYCREIKYSPYDNPGDFSSLIRIKKNAPELFRRALSRVQKDLVFTGDYQPVERKFRLSRQMLEICCELGFPVFVLERSPLVLKDLDILQAINDQAPSIVAFSIISTPKSAHFNHIKQMEHFAPLPQERFDAMQTIAKEGILTGTCFMPILPGLCDDDANLEAVIQKTADHGGRFVLASSLTLSDRQKTYFFNKMRESMSDLLPLYENLFPPESYAPHEDYWHRIALRVRDLCMKYNISDRIPRPIIPGEKFALNKRIVEKLANTSYEMELRKEKPYHIWAYRKAAWAVEDLDRDISLIHQRMGLKGLQSIPNIGPRLGEKIAEMLPGLNYEIG